MVLQEGQRGRFVFCWCLVFVGNVCGRFFYFFPQNFGRSLRDSRRQEKEQSSSRIKRGIRGPSTIF